MHLASVSPYVIATNVSPGMPAMQSSSEALRPPPALARRRQPSGTPDWSRAQHCAAMPMLSASCGHSDLPADEVTASSPGHRQKRAVSVSELPAKMAMPASGILIGGNGGKAGGEGAAGGGCGMGGSGGGAAGVGEISQVATL